MSDGLHRGQPVAVAGRPLAEAAGAMILVHGRGATAESILELAEEFGRPDLAYLAPQAAHDSWYPGRFLSPLAENEPWLSSALGALGDLLDWIAEQGVPPERTVLLGFSQGACLSLERAARNPRRYGGVVALSGALVGPPGMVRSYPGGPDGLAGTPFFLGCSDRDPHIPRPSVDESAEILRTLGGAVTERIYPGLGHTVNGDEIRFVRDLLAGLTAGS